jgi:CheY-like chemotaxis protein
MLAVFVCSTTVSYGSDGEIKEASLSSPIMDFHKKAEEHLADVLIIDDNPVKRMGAANAMKMIGLTSVTANGGEDGVESYERQHPGIIVVVDFEMPDINGDVVAQLIRKMSLDKDPKDKGPPIILNSTCTDAREQYKDSDLFDAIVETTEQLKAAVKNVIPKALSRKNSLESGEVQLGSFADLQ